MKFYGREREIAALRHERDISHETARFTVITGRRRVGKTELIRQAFDDGLDDYVYLLLRRENEKALCARLQASVERQFGDKFRIHGHAELLIDLVETIFDCAASRPLTVVIDEFQEMQYVDSAFYGEFQGLWDRVHRTHKLNLVVSGSVNRMMNEILFNYSAALYGRNTAHLRLNPFPVSLLKKILKDYSPRYKNRDLLDLWTITGGVARYVSMLMDAGAITRKKMLAAVFSPLSPFIEEGRSILAQEFGTEYTNYFSILTSIASGHTRFSEIEQDLGLQVVPYLNNLEKNYGFIRKTLPIFAPIRAKNAAYHIEDMFFRFWFRYVFRNQEYIELGRFEELQDLVARDLDAFTGYALERYFYWKFVEDSDYTRMGGWWDRKGENEIDLVCEDESQGILDFYEIKREKSRISIKDLKGKTEAFFAKNPTLKDRTVHCRGLAVEEM